MQNQNKREITFDTQLKTALSYEGKPRSVVLRLEYLHKLQGGDGQVPSRSHGRKRETKRSSKGESEKQNLRSYWDSVQT